MPPPVKKLDQQAPAELNRAATEPPKSAGVSDSDENRATIELNNDFDYGDEEQSSEPNLASSASSDSEEPSDSDDSESLDVVDSIRPPAAPARKALRSESDLDGLRKGLEKSRAEGSFFGKLRNLFREKTTLSDELYEHLEETLLSGDVGTATTSKLLETLRRRVTEESIKDTSTIWKVLKQEAVALLASHGDSGSFRLAGEPTVVLFVGVNGAGKTTTIGKLATKLVAENKSCVLAAGDTFRAAAVQQLMVWGSRVGCEVVRGKDGADPGAVIFEAIEKAKLSGANLVLADTAGRLHTKSNLMSELQKIARSAEKALSGCPHEILLVLDGTMGQNALAQAKQFQEALPLTGIVVTKLDGTAKGGAILGIADTLGLPIRFAGLGESASDLHDFSPESFIEALLGQDD